MSWYIFIQFAGDTNLFISALESINLEKAITTELDGKPLRLQSNKVSLNINISFNKQWYMQALKHQALNQYQD